MKRSRQAESVSVQVKGKGLSVTPELHDHVVSKMQRLARYLDRLQTIDVELWRESARAAEDQNHVEATAHVPGRTLRVETCNADMFAAIDEAVDRLYRQINRKKERMKAHHGVKPAEILELEPDTDDTSPTDINETVIHVEKLSVKPEFEDEAVEALETQGRPFYVFLNARNERINVLYRRTDGSYGLVEPTGS